MRLTKTQANALAEQIRKELRTKFEENKELRLKQIAKTRTVRKLFDAIKASLNELRNYNSPSSNPAIWLDNTNYYFKDSDDAIMQRIAFRVLEKELYKKRKSIPSTSDIANTLIVESIMSEDLKALIEKVTNKYL